MPVINPLWVAAMRRQWPLVGAAVVFLLFLLVHTGFFRPTADRYQRVIRQAEDLGLAVDPMASPEIVPPRAYAVLTANAMASRVAKEQGDSGALSASLVEVVSRLAARRGMDVIVTEPAPTTQLPQSVIVRTHMRVRASYAQFVQVLADLSAQEQLMAVDRFTLQPSGGGDQIVDLQLSRYILKQAPAKP